MGLISTAPSGSTLIVPNVAPDIAYSVYREADMMAFLFDNGLAIDAQGSSPFKWNVAFATTAGAAYSEGDAVSTYTNDQYAMAELPSLQVRDTKSISGLMRDNSNAGGTYVNLLDETIRTGTANVMKAFDALLCNSTVNQGIASIVDANDAYAGLAVATYTSWVSLESGSIGALTLNGLEDAYVAVRSTPRLGNPTHILTAPNQIVNLARLVTQYNFMSNLAPDYGRLGDAASPKPQWKTSVTWNGLECVSIRGITNTELYMIDVPSGFNFVMSRPLDVRKLADANDDDRYQVSLHGALRVFKRNCHGKMTGITA